MTNLEIIDTHQHMWDLSRHRHPWVADLPTLNRSFLPDDYRAAAAEAPEGVRVVKTVFVECDAVDDDMEREARWVYEIIDSPGSLTAAVVANCRPEQDGFEAYLDRIADPKLKGVRRILHTSPDKLSQSERFAANVRTLGPRGLTFDLCVLARQLPVAVQLVRKCPQTQFIVDHCGVPDIKGGQLDPWRQDLKALADLPNVVGCKISGLVAYVDSDNWSAADLQPYVEHTVECFGHDRIMFGGDWPVCTLTCSLGTWITTAVELTKDWSVSDQQKLFSRNAKRIYRL